MSHVPRSNEVLQELAGESSGGCSGDTTPETDPGCVDVGLYNVSEPRSVQISDEQGG